MFVSKKEWRFTRLERRVDELEYRLAMSEMKNWREKMGNTPPPPTLVTAISDFENRYSKIDCRRVSAGMGY